MLKFLKNLFGKEEPPEEVEFLRLHQWLEKNYYEKVSAKLSEVKDFASQLLESMKALEKKDISQQKVEEKLKTVVLGNKEAFLKALRLLVQKLQNQKKGLKAYAAECEQELSSFNQKTQKNFFLVLKF